MASPTEPVDLNRASRQEMLWLGWIPMQDVEAIVQQHGPDGTLYFSRLMETTSLTRTMLNDLIQRRWVWVHLSDEDFETFKTRSNVSSSTSMRDEIEVLREQNRMLRDAMGDQTRVQEEVLLRLVDEMAGQQRPEAATLPSSEVVRPGRLTGVEDLFAGRPSVATAGLDMGNESLMWDDMEQPRPSAAQRRLTKPFLTPLEVRPLLDESSSDGYVPQGFTRLGNQTVAQQPQQPGVGVMGNVAPVSDQQSGDGGMWVVIQDFRGQFEALLQETRQSRVALQGAEIHGAGAVREVRSDYAGRTDDMVAGHQRGPLGDGGPWARGTPGGSLGQPQAQFWHGDGRPPNFPYVAGAGVPDDRSKEVRPVISDMEGDWAQGEQYPSALMTQQRQLPLVAPQQPQLPVVPARQRQFPSGISQQTLFQPQPPAVPTRQQQRLVGRTQQIFAQGAPPQPQAMGSTQQLFCQARSRSHNFQGQCSSPSHQAHRHNSSWRGWHSRTLCHGRSRNLGCRRLGCRLCAVGATWDVDFVFLLGMSTWDVDFVPWAQSQLGMSTPQSALPGAQSQQQPMPVVPLQGQHQPVGEYLGVPVNEDDSHYTSDGRNGFVSSQSRTHGTRQVRDCSDHGSQSEVRASHSRRRQPSRASQRTRRSSSRWWRRTSSSSSEGSRSPSAGVSGRRRWKSPSLPKPQMFSGKAGEWNSFIFQFAKTARYYGWDQHDKADRLLASLRGKAVDFIRKKQRKVQDDYRTLRDTLEQRFGKLEHPIAARCQLLYVRQEEGESIEDFADRILTKVNKAYPGIEMEQDLAKDAFLRGCQNRSAAYAAAEKDPETLQDALEEVQNSVVNLKAFGRGSAVTRQISFAGREEKEEEDSGTEEEKVRKLFEKFMKERHSERSGRSRGRSAMRCYSCNGLGHMQRDCTEGPSCFGCGEKGHMRADCPKPDSAGGQSRGRGRGRGGRGMHLN